MARDLKLAALSRRLAFDAKRLHKRANNTEKYTLAPKDVAVLGKLAKAISKAITKL